MTLKDAQFDLLRCDWIFVDAVVIAEVVDVAMELAIRHFSFVGDVREDAASFSLVDDTRWGPAGQPGALNTC